MLKSRSLKPIAGPVSLQDADANAPQTLTALEREFLPPLLEIQETPPSPLKRHVSLTLVFLVLILLIWSYFGQIDVVSTAPGKFIPDGKIKVIQPLDNAIVKTILVKEGQQVKAGDLLLELDPTITGADLSSSQEKDALKRAEDERLEAELTGKQVIYRTKDPAIIRLQDHLLQVRRAAYSAKLAQSRSDVASKRDTLAAALDTLNKFKETTAIAQEKEADARPLVETGAVSRLDYLQLKQDLVSNENDYQAQINNVAQNRADVDKAEQAVAAVIKDNQSSILADMATHATDIAALKGDVTKAKQLYDMEWLRAPVDGLVQSVNVTTTGEVVTPAQTLVSIVPKDTPLIVEATLSNDDVGFVKVGQHVEIKVDTFPFQKYGTIPGTVTWISPDAEDNSNPSTMDVNQAKSSKTEKQKLNGVQSSGLTYKVHIKPNRHAMKVDDQWVMITPGMTLQADIQTERRRVIEFFLSPVIKYLDEGMTVR